MEPNSVDLKSVIVKRNYERFCSGEVKSIREVLVKKGCDIAKKKLSERSRYYFAGCRLINEDFWYLVVCGNEHTAKIVNCDLHRDWRDRHFRVYPMTKIPRKCQIWTYAQNTVTTKDDFLPMMQTMNRGLGLRVDQWVLKRWTGTKHGIFIKVEVSEKDADIVQKEGHLAFECTLQPFYVMKGKSIEEFVNDCCQLPGGINDDKSAVIRKYLRKL